MSFPIRSIVVASMLALLAASASAAPPFVPPTEAMPPFRRDKLPIDTDSMASLSKDIERLSLLASFDEAPQRRATAQAYALALALDPANSSARTALSRTAEGKSRERNFENLDPAKARIWKLHAWLSSPEAGPDGKLLADLLGDTAATLNPDHPTATALRDSGELGKWDGWVAPITAFEEREAILPQVIAKTDPKPTDKTPDPKLPSALKPSKASITAVLHSYREDKDSYVLGPVTVSMDASSRNEGENEDENNDQPLRINISCHETVRGDVSEKIARPIAQALGEIHGVSSRRLPTGDIRLRTGKAENYSFRRNGIDMTGPGFILANSALTGIAPNTTFIGTLDRRGEKLLLPDYFWKKIATLFEGEGGRLVVPAAAEESLTALLALEKPEFFLRYEVLLASSPQEAIRLCSAQPDDELSATLAKFKEIKDKSTSAALGSYLANTFVRKRLVEIYQTSPYHLSAKLLAIQGAGARPRALEKKILAAEVFEAIDPVHPFANIELWDLNKEKVAVMEAAHEASRARLDRLERYAEMRDRDLIKKAVDVITDLRAMTRIIRDRREMWEKTDDISRTQRKFRNSDRDFRRELSLLTGDPLPKDKD